MLSATVAESTVKKKDDIPTCGEGLGFDKEGRLHQSFNADKVVVVTVPYHDRYTIHPAVRFIMYGVNGCIPLRTKIPVEYGTGGRCRDG